MINFSENSKNISIIISILNRIEEELIELKNYVSGVEHMQRNSDFMSKIEAADIIITAQKMKIFH